MIGDLFEKHKLVRRSMVAWALALITWVVYAVFSNITLITASVVSALGIVVGILATVIGHYQWSRNREDHHKAD